MPADRSDAKRWVVGITDYVTPPADIETGAFPEAEFRFLSDWRASDAGRAVFATSGVGQIVVPYWGPYAVSKAGLEMLVKVYAAEIAKTAVRANIVNPGATRTGMRAEAMPGEDPMTLKTPDDVAGLFVDLAEPACRRNGEVIRFEQPAALDRDS